MSDVRVLINVEAELARKDTFTKRAMRTRGRDIRRAAGYDEFCLGDPLPLREVVDKVSAGLSSSALRAPGLEARQFVYASLRRHYPFKTPDSKR